MPVALRSLSSDFPCGERQAYERSRVSGRLEVLNPRQHLPAKEVGLGMQILNCLVLGGGMGEGWSGAEGASDLTSSRVICEA